MPISVTLTINFIRVGAVESHSRVVLSSIINEAKYFAFLETAPYFRHSLMDGPYLGWFKSHLSNSGHPFPAAQALSITKGTVGSPGRGMPISAKVIEMVASIRHNTTRII